MENSSHELLRHLKPMAHHLDGLESELKDRGQVPEVSIKSLPILNQKLWGLRKGLTVIAARTSQGKSAAALQIALDVAEQGLESVILSLEMDVPSMLERMACNAQRIDNYALLTGQYALNDEIKAKFKAFRDKIEDMPLLITCGIGKTFRECNQFIELMDPKPKVVILDYIQMAKTFANERSDIAEYIRQFRQLMIENGMRGIICSQINRQVEKDNDYRPRLENLKGTGALEEVSDVCLLLHWNYFYTKIEAHKNSYDIQIAKNRHGRTSTHKVRYIPENYRFEEDEYEEYIK